MQMIGQLPQSFGLIHGSRTLLQPTTSPSFHIPAASLIQHEEVATTLNKLKHKLQAQGMVKLHKTHSIVAPIPGAGTLAVTGRMPLLEHPEVVVQEGAMTHERPLLKMVRLSTTT